MGSVLLFAAMDQMPNRIRELRKAREWDLEDLADRVGISTTFMSDLERGKRDLGFVWMKRIAKALKVQPGDLLTEQDNSKSLAPDELDWLSLYQRADEAQRAQLLQMARIIVPPQARSRKAA